MRRCAIARMCNFEDVQQCKSASASMCNSEVCSCENAQLSRCATARCATVGARRSEEEDEEDGGITKMRTHTQRWWAK